jgi:hypothetical protein
MTMEIKRDLDRMLPLLPLMLSKRLESRHRHNSAPDNISLLASRAEGSNPAEAAAETANVAAEAKGKG